MTSTKSVALTTQESALALWGSTDGVNALAARVLQMVMPGGNRLNQQEALTLAQMAILHGLDPTNGEIWLIKAWNGDVLGTMVGIKGLRRKAHEQLRIEAPPNMSVNYWPEFQVLTDSEKEIFGIPKRALAFRCLIRDTLTKTTYIDAIRELRELDMQWEMIERVVGFEPYTDGIGYAMPDKPDPDCPKCAGSGWYETRKLKPDGRTFKKARCDCYEESKMILVQRAMKRAEAEALKRRFDLPFGTAIGVQGAEILDGQYTVLTDGDDPDVRREGDTRETRVKREMTDAQGNAPPDSVESDEIWRVSWHTFAQRALAEFKRADDSPRFSHLNHLINALNKARGETNTVYWDASGRLLVDGAELWQALETYVSQKDTEKAED